MLGAVVVVAAAAAVDALRGRAAAPPAARASPVAHLADDRLRGPDVPAAGALPGALVLAEPGSCRLRTLSSRRSSSGRRDRDGLRALGLAGRGAGGGVDRARRRESRESCARSPLVRLGERPATEDDASSARRSVRSPGRADGSQVAWCVRARRDRGARDREQENERRVCRAVLPAFAAGRQRAHDSRRPARRAAPPRTARRCSAPRTISSAESSPRRRRRSK